jgi:hypothetical protein
MPFANPNRYAYTELCVEKHCPAASGVYVLYSTGGFTWEVIYVGEAEDVQKSLLQHLEGDNACIVDRRPTSFIAERVDAERRRARCDELIGEYSPTCQ